MHKVKHIGTLYTVVLLLFAYGVHAQPGSQEASTVQILKDKSMVLRSADSVNVALISHHPQFSQLDEISYYRNEKMLKQIFKAEKQNDLVLMEQYLTDYIQNFGIENFWRDVSLLWKAGRVKELLKDTTMALYYYEMAHNHNYGTQAPKLAYDTLNAPTHADWLPIDEYYELLGVRQKIDPLTPPKKVLSSMGASINSEKPDYAPFMHPTDSLLIFTSRRELKNIIDPFIKPNEDLYFSYRDVYDGSWIKAEKLGENINTRYNEGSACIGPNGRTLYFTRCNDPEGLGECDLYQADFDAASESWVNVKNLGSRINSEYWDSQPNISEDGKYLFFVSNRKGGFGGTDIYYSMKDESGEWSQAKNLGPMINSPRQEVTPFFHKINKTLYFSSLGQITNFGGFDIFKSRWILDTWESPKNVGPLVNTAGNEYYFSIDGAGERIFYAKSDGQDTHESQNFDLYSFDMPMEARPDAISTLKGYLLDSISGNPLQGTIMVIDLDNNVEIAPKQINSEGYFEFDLKKNNRYRLIVMGNNYLTLENDIIFNNDTTFNILNRSFEENKPIIFESLKFGSNSYKVKSGIKPKLDYIVKFLELYPMFNLTVEGHTDSDGKDATNLELSIKRARMIASYILNSGSFEESRIDATGYGSSKPLVPNDTKENKQKNRRVEFKLYLNPEYEGDLPLPTAKDLKFKEEKPKDGEIPWEDELDTEIDLESLTPDKKAEEPEEPLMEEPVEKKKQNEKDN